MAVDHEKVSAFVFFFSLLQQPTAILSVRRESEEQLINAFNLLIEIEIVRCVPKPYFLNLDALTMTMMRLIFEAKSFRFS